MKLSIRAFPWWAIVIINTTTIIIIYTFRYYVFCLSLEPDLPEVTPLKRLFLANDWPSINDHGRNDTRPIRRGKREKHFFFGTASDLVRQGKCQFFIRYQSNDLPPTIFFFLFFLSSPQSSIPHTWTELLLRPSTLGNPLGNRFPSIQKISISKKNTEEQY
jgi:hypothetical protein